RAGLLRADHLPQGRRRPGGRVSGRRLLVPRRQDRQGRVPVRQPPAGPLRPRRDVAVDGGGDARPQRVAAVQTVREVTRVPCCSRRFPLKNPIPRRRGFTLIELLVVIAII